MLNRRSDRIIIINKWELSLLDNRSNLRTLIVRWYVNNSVTEKELQKLYKNFQKIDKDKSGTLEPEEFFDIPGKHIFWS